jgi:hypothetical protein
MIGGYTLFRRLISMDFRRNAGGKMQNMERALSAPGNIVIPNIHYKGCMHKYKQ